MEAVAEAAALKRYLWRCLIFRTAYGTVREKKDTVSDFEPSFAHTLPEKGKKYLLVWFV